MRRDFLGVAAGFIAGASAAGSKAAQSSGSLSAIVTIGGARFEFREAGGSDLGDFSSEVGGFTQRCIRAVAPGTDLVVYFRPDRDSERVEVVFELGRLFGGKPADLGAYSVTLQRGGAVLATVAVPAHYWFSRWRWQSAPRPIVRSIRQLVSERLLPPYDLAAWPAPAANPPPVPGESQEPAPVSGVPQATPPVNNGAAPDRGGSFDALDPFFGGWYFEQMQAVPGADSPAGSSDLTGGTITRERAAASEETSRFSYSLMGLAGLTAYMPTTGEREDIGLLTERQADYVLTASAAALAALRAQAEAAGTIPWHMRDENTGAPIDFTVYRGASWYFDANVGKPHIARTTTPVTIDSAHQPAVAYLPYLLTGDPYHLEDLHFQANWNWGNLPPNYRPSIPQTRSFAWTLRSLAQAAKVTPSDVPSWMLPQTYWRALLEEHRAFFEDSYVNSVNPLHTRFRSTANIADSRAEAPSLTAGTWVDPWQEEFLVCVMGWMLLMGFRSWETAFSWKIGSTLARTSGASGWPRSYATPYRLVLRATSREPVVADWAAAWALTRDTLKLANPDAQTWQTSDLTYLAYTRGSLVFIKALGAANVDDALAWATAQLRNRKWNTALKWRLGDPI